MHFLFELLLQPVFDFVLYALYVIGYATACVIVPVFTLGQVIVEPSRNEKAPKPKRGGRMLQTDPRKYAMKADVAACVGVLFWILVAVGVYLLRQG